jgi:D-3-phosphoglycerate dehydrogenase / 2-oxoglutarate reductase
MKILFIDKVHPKLQELLENNGHYCQLAYNQSQKEIIEIIAGFDGIVIRSRFKIDRDFLAHCTKLKFIARAGSGMENIDSQQAKIQDIKLFNAPEGNRQAVAEHCLAMLLNLFNHISRSDKQVRNGIWNREQNRGVELSGKTVAIIGYGNNGSAFAKALSGFDCNVIAYDKYLENINSQYAVQKEMSDIYIKADVVSLHVPLTDETNYLVNKEFINSFKKPFYLINTARGKCANTKDIVSALDSKKILGVCLDVHEYEKSSFESIDQIPSDLKKILESKKAIFSPHIAGWTQESNQKISEVLYQKITDSFPS